MVWGCGRGFLATLSLTEIRTSSFGEETGGSNGAESGSLGGASMFTLALMTVSLSFTPDRWNIKDLNRYDFAVSPDECFMCFCFLSVC